MKGTLNIRPRTIYRLLLRIFLEELRKCVKTFNGKSGLAEI
jgi:hypothetical protein